MKSRSISAKFIFLALAVVSLTMGMASFAQQEIAQTSVQNDELILILPKASLQQTIADTVLPTLCNSGKGLMQIESFSLPEARKDYRYNIKGSGITTAIRDEGFSEEELKNLQEQKHLMEEQYLEEWQQQLKTERYYFDLEGIIRGVNTAPLF